MYHTKNAPLAGARRCVLAIALAGTCSYAQTPVTPQGGTPEAELPPVTVSAHEGLAVPYDQTGVSVTILDIPQLKKEGVSTLSAALTTVPGVFVLPGGGATQQGNICSATVRGLSKGAYTLPMIDGMRIHASGNGNPGANILARTNLFDVGTAEILRGAQGATYGNGCMGAVVYLETPKGQGKPGMEIFQEAGSHGTYTGNVTAQGETGNIAFFLSTTYEHTNNDLEYADGTRPGQKHAGRYSQWSEALRVDGKLNEKNALTFTFRRSDSDYRDASNPATPASLYEFRTNLLTAAWSSKPTDRWTSKVMAGFYGYDADFGGGATGDIRNLQLEWRNAYEWSKMSVSTFGLCWARSQYRASDSYSKDSSLENTYSVFAEHTYRPTSAWEASLAARLDMSNVVDERLTVRAASGYHFTGSGTRLFGSIGTGYNAPSQFQRSRMTYHSPLGGDWTGNPALHCETSVSADFGVEQQVAGDHYATATLFWTRTQDAVVADYSVYPFTYRNSAAHQTSHGIELALRGTWEKHWNTGYTVGLTLARPMSGGAQIPDSARQVWSADIHTSPLEKLTTGIGLAAACQRTGYDSARLDDYYTLRWYVRYDVSENLSLHLRVENLTNQKFISQPGYNDPVFGYPAMLGAGIGVYAGCSFRF